MVFASLVHGDHGGIFPMPLMQIEDLKTWMEDVALEDAASSNPTRKGFEECGG